MRGMALVSLDKHLSLPALFREEMEKTPERLLFFKVDFGGKSPIILTSNC